MNALLKTAVLLLFCSLYLAACTNLGVFEKDVPLKKQQWPASYKPSFAFTITDTTAAYQIYLVLRHTDAYNFNNIWVKFTRTGPDTSYTQQADLTLANNAQGWLGTGMDDIWEHRVPITQSPIRFRRSGKYEFTLEQIMRQDPLLHVLNAGLRVEKVN